jgi:hypothetical protein
VCRCHATMRCTRPASDNFSSWRSIKWRRWHRPKICDGIIYAFCCERLTSSALGAFITSSASCAFRVTTSGGDLCFGVHPIAKPSLMIFATINGVINLDERSDWFFQHRTLTIASSFWPFVLECWMTIVPSPPPSSTFAILHRYSSHSTTIGRDRLFDSIGLPSRSVAIQADGDLRRNDDLAPALMPVRVERFSA